MGNIAVNDNLYNQAIQVAANEKDDLVMLVENFLQTYVKNKKADKNVIKVPASVRNIGIPTDVSADYDIIGEYRNHLLNKYQ